MKELSQNNDTISESELYESVGRVFEFDFVTGLPCGELRHFIERSAESKEIVHLPATNEREVVGIAQGAWLAGKKPVLYMQNSGMFESSNDIASLLIPCKTPALFVVSWRGAPGENATQHFYTGAATIPLLESLGLPYVENINHENLVTLKTKMEKDNLPGFILVKRERFNDMQNNGMLSVINTRPRADIKNEGKDISLSRENALDEIFKSVSCNDAVISSTGLISRSVFQNHDDENQFYNAGAFGLTNMIALGFSMNKPGMRTIIIEGDGSVLTNLGSLNVIGHHSPSNFTHIVLDNQAYVSCSGEQTFGSSVIPEVARDFGYSKIYTVQTTAGLQVALSDREPGSKMVHVQINKVGERNFRRPLDMDKVAIRFRDCFVKSK